jgi:hypothetical protein
MKTMPLRGFALLPLVLATTAIGEALPHLFESDGTGPPNNLIWQTQPGIRYDLWKSDDLSDWQRVTGYPAMAEGLAMEHAFTPGPGGKGSSLTGGPQPSSCEATNPYPPIHSSP